MIGTFLGGYLGDKLAITDKRWYLWVPAIGLALSTPTSLIYYLTDNITLAIICQFLTTLESVQPKAAVQRVGLS